jgi:hypothetical protein
MFIPLGVPRAPHANIFISIWDTREFSQNFRTIQVHYPALFWGAFPTDVWGGRIADLRGAVGRLSGGVWGAHAPPKEKLV